MAGVLLLSNGVLCADALYVRASMLMDWSGSAWRIPGWAVGLSEEVTGFIVLLVSASVVQCLIPWRVCVVASA